MHGLRRALPAPALVVAVVALIAALAGSAIALPGTNTVSKSDLKGSAVGGAELRQDAVKSSDIADGKVGAAELTDSEAFHRLGAAGEPGFLNGTDGDCVWGPTLAAGIGLNPIAFYKDPLDVVHLVGSAAAQDGAGGDGSCDATVAGEVEDGIVFILPSGYRPENVQLGGFGGGEVLIFPEEGGAISGDVVPGGAVLSASSGTAALDGITLRAAGPATEGIETRAPAKLPAIEKLSRILAAP